MRPSSESFLDTIVALATPGGRSALAVLRVSGDKTREILHRLAPTLSRDPCPRRAYLAWIIDPAGARIDRGLVTFYPAPHSVTGEDVAEFSIHGSPPVARRLLDAAAAAGARPARAGEFTERAFLRGKIDLVEAESIRDLIEARTEAAARASARRLEGELSQALFRLRDDLLDAAAALAATIDFSEDVGETVPAAALARLQAAEAGLEKLSASYATGRLLSAGFRVAILGRPNAGKSTLFNALLGSARAIVTEVPGTTRDTLEATVEIAGIPVELVDTAGLRQSSDRVERLGIERARQAGEGADAVLYVFDAAVEWNPEDSAAVAELDGKPMLILANKIDRAHDPQAVPAGSHRLCAISSDAGEKVRALLEKTLAASISTESTSEILGTARQKDLVDRALAGVRETLDSLSRRESPEYAAARLDDALAALADLFGETTSEDVLQRIFASFCIGK